MSLPDSIIASHNGHKYNASVCLAAVMDTARDALAARPAPAEQEAPE